MMEPENAQLDISVQALVVLNGMASTAEAYGLLSGPKLSTRAQIHVWSPAKNILESWWKPIIIHGTYSQKQASAISWTRLTGTSTGSNWGN